MVKIDTECKDCGGTGLYCGFAEPKGTAVICLGCKGSGCKKISYIPFNSRKNKYNITIVRRSKGSLIVADVGPTGGMVTYKEFQRGKMPL